MAYNFNLSDGITPVTIADGAIDTTQFSIGLIGKNVSGYGQSVAQSMVHMLEHFASTSSPTNPTTGQLWYNTSTNTMNVYNGSGWVPIATDDGVVSGDLLPAVDGCPAPPGSNIGSPSLRFCNMYAVTFNGDLNGTASQAQYADLAERFESDAAYEIGTVVKIGGDKEVTQTTEYADTDVLGVVSEKPGFLMNSKAGDDDTHPAIALAGRVPVLLDGPVSKGDRLVASSTPGHARKGDISEISPFSVIGRALEDSEGGEVLAVLGAK
jgi:hypothetical protein